MHYRIEWPSDNSAALILKVVLRSLADNTEMQTDVARLERACCEPTKYVSLESAPTPTKIE